jgi:carboxypeptidase Q
MRRRLRFFLFFLFTCAISVCCALAQASADRLITEALKPSPLETNLHQLTDEIGGRIPGTPAMQKAVDWAVEAFKAAGADSVHTEDFTLPASWAEGRGGRRLYPSWGYFRRASSGALG